MRWMISLALASSLMGTGCVVGPSIDVRPHRVDEGYREIARVMPLTEAQATLREVLEVARSDDPNRNDSPLEGITVTETHFEVTGVCYDAEGHNMGRSPFKRPFRYVAPKAYAFHAEGEPTVYFVTFDGPYEIPGMGSWKSYPSLLSECLWFSQADDVEDLFEAVTCLKSRSAEE